MLLLILLFMLIQLMLLLLLLFMLILLMLLLLLLFMLILLMLRQLLMFMLILLMLLQLFFFFKNLNMQLLLLPLEDFHITLAITLLFLAILQQELKFCQGQGALVTSTLDHIKSD